MVAVGDDLNTVVGAAGRVCGRCIGVATAVGYVGCKMLDRRHSSLPRRSRKGNQGIPWITIPASRLLLGPWRNLKVTVPGVVGVHVNVVGLPAVREKPPGTLKGLGFAARATAESPPRMESSERRILIRRRLDCSIISDSGRNLECKKDEADIYYSKRENALIRRKSIQGLRTSGRTRSQKVSERERESDMPSN